MTPERWQQIDRIVEAALDQPPNRRESFVVSLCAGDIDLCHEVLSLLKSLTEAEDYLESPPREEIGELFPVKDNLAEPEGRMIGHYRIVERIAEGGMGVVYRARRQDGEYDQEVAIKLIPASLFSAELARRFRQERQILARLIHPNITRLLDGGSTEEGQPFLVMEFVDGVPITEYCDRWRLPIAERLRLVRKVCLAVQHAHQNLVVHRDLKPGNIFITPDGKVKLLDFGIAKILDTERLQSGSGPNTKTMVMTPEYASPEQVLGEPVTTVSDVYSLGVVLYELLTGGYPYGFKNRSLAEMVRVICEEEPVWPSQIPFNGQAESIAEVREGTVEKLRARLRGDPDSIVMKALRKDPAERYQSAAMMAEDIRRHLEGKAVSARPATWRYRTSKFVRRNRAFVVATILIALSVAGGFLSTLRQASISREHAKVNRRLAYAGQMHRAAQAWQVANISELDDLLDRTMPGPDDEDLRDFEWFYFKRLRQKNGEVITIRHTAELWAVACSPDNRLLAIGGDDGVIKLVEIATGREERMLRGHQGHIVSLAFSPDSRWLITGSGDRTARIWDTSTGQPLITLQGHGNWVTTVAFSPDGERAITGSRDGTVRLWDARTGVEVIALDGQASWVHSLAVSPDGRRLAVTYAARPNILIWDLGKRRRIASFDGKSLISSIQFSSDGETIYAADRDRKLFILDGQRLSLIRELPPHAGEIKSLSLSPSGRMAATASTDRMIRLWDLGSGREVRRYLGHLGQVWGVAFTADGRRLVSAGDDNTARIWDIDENPDIQDWTTKSGIYSFARFSADDGFLAMPDQGQIRIWDLTAQNFAQSYPIASPNVSAAFSPDGKELLAGDNFGSIDLFDLTTESRITSLSAHSGKIGSIEVAPRGETFAAASFDRTVSIWDMATLARMHSLSHPGLVSSVAYSPNGRILASGCYDNVARLWDPRTGQEIFALQGHTEPILSLDFSPDGAILATGSADSTIRLWDVSSGRQLSIIKAHGGHVKTLDFSPDGKRLATGGDDGLLRLWDIRHGLEIVALFGHNDVIKDVRFSRNGTMLLSASVDGIIRLWRAH